MLYILIVIAKVDLEKFICSLLGINYDRMKLLIEYALTYIIIRDRPNNDFKDFAINVIANLISNNTNELK